MCCAAKCTRFTFYFLSLSNLVAGIVLIFFLAKPFQEFLPVLTKYFFEWKPVEDSLKYIILSGCFLSIYHLLTYATGYFGLQHKSRVLLFFHDVLNFITLILIIVLMSIFYGYGIKSGSFSNDFAITWIPVVVYLVASILDHIITLYILSAWKRCVKRQLSKKQSTPMTDFENSNKQLVPYSGPSYPYPNAEYMSVDEVSGFR